MSADIISPIVGAGLVSALGLAFITIIPRKWLGITMYLSIAAFSKLLKVSIQVRSNISPWADTRPAPTDGHKARPYGRTQGPPLRMDTRPAPTDGHKARPYGFTVISENEIRISGVSSMSVRTESMTAPTPDSFCVPSCIALDLANPSLYTMNVSSSSL